MVKTRGGEQVSRLPEPGARGCQALGARQRSVRAEASDGGLTTAVCGGRPVGCGGQGAGTRDACPRCCRSPSASLQPIWPHCCPPSG